MLANLHKTDPHAMGLIDPLGLRRGASFAVLCSATASLGACPVRRVAMTVAILMTTLGLCSHIVQCSYAFW